MDWYWCFQIRQGSRSELPIAERHTHMHTCLYVALPPSFNTQVVGLVCFDLRRRGKLGKLSMVGTNGSKYPAIRAHLDKNIGEKYKMDTS